MAWSCVAPLLCLLAGAIVVRWLLRTAAHPAADALRGVPVPLADALLGGTALVAAAGLAWLLLGVALELLSRLPGGIGRTSARVSGAVTPRLVRRAVGLTLGMGMGAGLAAGPSLAAPARAVSVAVQESVEGAVLVAGGGTASATRGTTPATTATDGLPDPGWSPAPDPGWTPEAPVVRPQPDVTAVTAAGRRSAHTDRDEVVVRRGDSLWTIAARHLGPGATDGEVAAEWPRWYAANRAVIGPDPDLVLPGQILRAPEDPR